MFGLSRKELLQKIIMNACHAKLCVYKENVKRMLLELERTSKPDEADMQLLFTGCRKEYLNAVCDAVTSTISLSDPSFIRKFNMGLLAPSISGLPPEIDVEYLDTNGISAGWVYILVFFAMTRKPLNSPKDYRTASKLSHYQNDLMDLTLSQLSDEF